MKRIPLIAIIIQLWSYSSAQTESIEAMMKKKEYSKANKAATALYKASQRDYNILTMLARTEIALGQNEESFGHLSEAIALQPEEVEGWLLRSHVLYSVGEMRGCIADATRAIEIKTNKSEFDTIYSEALLARGSCYQHNGDYHLAIADQRIILEQDSNSVPALNNMAMSLESVGEVDQSILLLKRIIALDSTWLGAYINLGFTLTGRGQYNDALRYYEKAIRLDSKNPYLLNNMGFCTFKVGRHKEGIRLINRSLKYWKENAYAYYYLGQIYLELGDQRKGCDALQKAYSFGFNKIYGNEVDVLRDKHCL